MRGVSSTGSLTDLAAGDVNGDGYEDIVVASYGQFRVFEGTAGGLAESPSVTVTIDSTYAAHSVACGDVNGDGYQDVVVGLPYEAAIQVYEGSPTGLSTEATTVTSTVASRSDQFAWNLDSAGDVNGDGCDDILVGAYQHGGGYAAVFMGSPSGIEGTPAFEESGSSYFGWGVGGAGDVNGDGFDDVAVAEGATHTYIYHGSSTGLPGAPDVILAPAENAQAVGGVGDLNDDGYGDFAIAFADDTYVYPGGPGGPDPSNYTLLTDGSGTLTNAGDVNSDGVDDLVVGACLGTDPSILLYLGDPAGVSTTPTTTLTTSRNSYYAYALASGDIDDDGFPEVVATDSEWEDVGGVFLYAGSPSADLPHTQTLLGSTSDELGLPLANLGDVNGDGYDDAAIGAPYSLQDAGSVDIYTGSSTGLSTVPHVEWVGSSAGVYFGYGVDGAGDVNGDGFADVVVGSLNDGAAFVYQGSSSGLSASPAATILNASAHDFGRTVRGLGDVNGDGYSDIGVTGNDEYAYVYAGSSTGVSTSPGSVLGLPVFGDALCTTALRDLNGDGFDDVALVNRSRGNIQMFQGSSLGLATTDNLAVRFDSGDGLAGLGDVDGDGYDDMAVGFAADSSDDGRIVLYTGSSTGVTEAGWVEGVDSERLGVAIVAAGDVDGDGYADLFAKGASARLEVFFGSSGGLVAGPTTTDLDGLLPDHFDAGDFNGDGHLDILAANPEAYENAGAAYVFSGGDDADGDGYLSFEDCDDSDASVVPTLRYADADGDGYGDPRAGANVCADAGYVDDATDCEDAHASAHPGGAEVCDPENVDEDCDGAVDDRDPDATGQTVFYADQDDDEHGIATETRLACDAGIGWASTSDDCDDTQAHIHPGRDELCDDAGVDEDCDGLIDAADPSSQADWYPDLDGDGFGSGIPVTSCEPVPGRVNTAGDCAGRDPAINPGADELCGTGVDEDCDGWIDDDDDSATSYRDDDGDGYGVTSSPQASCDVDGFALNPGDCDDLDPAVNPGSPEQTADGVDSDCDGLEECYVDADDDHARSTELVWTEEVDCSDDGLACAEAGIDCDDANSAVGPGSNESPGDGVDEDCDGGELCWLDADEDGFRSYSETTASEDEDCDDAGEARITQTPDCDDGDPTTHLGAARICDGGDHDCDGQEDRDCDSPPPGQGCACEGAPGGPAPALLWAVGALLVRRRARA